tara:strand:- start:2047 stop:2715 length:669 start_codon:yes stop_codon:yes gene_type:complete
MIQDLQTGSDFGETTYVDGFGETQINVFEETMVEDEFETTPFVDETTSIVDETTPIVDETHGFSEQLIDNYIYANSLTEELREIWYSTNLIDGIQIPSLHEVCDVYSDNWIIINYENILYGSYSICNVKHFYMIIKSFELLQSSEREYYKVSLLYYDNINIEVESDIQTFYDDPDIYGAFKQYHQHTEEYDNMDRIVLTFGFDECYIRNIFFEENGRLMISS